MLTSYIPFNVILSDNTILTIRDIFLYRNILTNFFTDSRTYMRYTIKSGDTPRSLSYYLYGGERYEWIIYCLNVLVNPYFDWPLSENDFYDMIEQKYFKKQCLFLKLDSFNNNFKVGETVYMKNYPSVTGVVDSWDRTLCKLTLKDVVGQFQINQKIQSSSSSAEIGRIIEKAEEAVHHFESLNGLVLDPYIGYLQLYISNTGEDTYVITNKIYEERENNKKRQIYVLRPEYVKATEDLLIRNINALSEIEAETRFL